MKFDFGNIDIISELMISMCVTASFENSNMGNASFAAATPALKDPFTAEELRRLRKRFSKIDVDHSQGLSADEFMKLPGISENPLAHRMIDIFDTDRNGVVDFQEFMAGMGVFSMKSDIAQKLRFAFQVYDIDQDGYISNGELFQVLKNMVEDSLTDIQLQQLVDKTIVYFDKDNDGKLSFDEFAEALRKMTKLVEVSKQMTFAV